VAESSSSEMTKTKRGAPLAVACHCFKIAREERELMSRRVAARRKEKRRPINFASRQCDALGKKLRGTEAPAVLTPYRGGLMGLIVFLCVFYETIFYCS